MLFFLNFWSFYPFLWNFFKFFGKKLNFGPNFWGNLKILKTTHNAGLRNYKDFSKKYTPMEYWWHCSSHRFCTSSGTFCICAVQCNYCNKLKGSGKPLEFRPWVELVGDSSSGFWPCRMTTFIPFSIYFV